MRLGHAVPQGKGGQLRFGQLLIYGLAVVSVAAGVVHCSASPYHARLPLHAAFFVTVGVAQIVWAPLILRHASRRLLYLGAAGNLALVGVWLFSRTTGIGFVPGAEEVEPVGFKDAVTVFLEVVLVAGVGLWALRPGGRELLLAKGRLAMGAMTGAVALLMAAGVAAPSHEHGHIDGEEVALNGHGGDRQEADHHGDERTAAHPAHPGEADIGHQDAHAHALAPGPGHALAHAHGDAPRAGAVRHGRHAHAEEGNSVEGVSHTHDHPSGSVEEGHRHDAASAEEGTHDHDPDHEGEQGDHGEHDHDHEGGGPLADVMAIIGEAGERLGL